jgi:hypothetical protein
MLEVDAENGIIYAVQLKKRLIVHEWRKEV